MGSQWAKACQDWLTAFRGQPQVQVRGRNLEGESRKLNFSSDKRDLEDTKEEINWAILKVQSRK